MDKPIPFVFASCPKGLKLQAQGAKVEALLDTAFIPIVEACVQREFPSDAAIADWMGLRSTTPVGW